MICHALRDLATIGPNRPLFLPHGRKVRAGKFTIYPLNTSNFPCLRKGWPRDSVLVQYALFLTTWKRNVWTGKYTLRQFMTSTFTCLSSSWRGWPRGTVLVQYAFCVREDWLFLIQAIDVSVLTDLNWLGMDLARPLESFFFSFFGLQDKYFLRCLQWLENVGLLADRPNPLQFSHLGIHHDCC